MPVESHRLTDAFVRNHTFTTPDQPRVEIKDTEQRGLRLRIGATTKVFYWIGRLRGGSTVQLKLAPFPDLNVKEARAAGARAQAMASAGTDPRLERASKPAPAPSGKALLQRFVKEHCEPKLKPKTTRDYVMSLERDFLPRLGHTPITDIAAQNIRDAVVCVRERVLDADGNGVAANRFLAHLKSMFSFGVDLGLLSDSPAASVKQMVKEIPRDRVLSDDELRLLLTHYASDKRHQREHYILRLLLLTAARRSEIATMRWADIDQRTWTWTIPADRTKNGRAHTIPLCTTAQAIIECVEPGSAGNDYLFTGRFPATHVHPDWITKIATRLQAATGALADFTIHDLRRAAATNIGKLTQTPGLVSLLLNHQTQGVTARYDLHSYDGIKRQALQKWDDFLTLLVPAP